MTHSKTARRRSPRRRALRADGTVTLSKTSARNSTPDEFAPQALAPSHLQELDALKATFISLAAHELRAPLTPLRGLVEMLADGDFGPLNPQQQDAVQIMRASVKRLMRLADDLLDATRLAAGKIELNLQTVNMRALLENTARDYVLLLNERHQELNVQIAPEVAEITCDPVRISQALTHLLDNASSHTVVDGTIRLCAELLQNQHVQVGVHDSGIGIAPQDYPFVFEQFYRTQNVGDVNARGSELGLHLARALVELHNGKIWFESANGRGSAFYFALPTSPQLARIE